MKIKTKLAFGVGLLFGLIILLAVVSIKYVNNLKTDTNNILVANYNSVEYARNMILLLDEYNTNSHAVSFFKNNLNKQLNNITEPGEKEITDAISKLYNESQKNISDSLVKNELRKDLTELMRVNMTAIEKKSEKAKETAESATVWIAATGTLCFIIAFILLINLPGNIADPLKEITDSIKEIAGQNYSQRVHFESNNEFGELAVSFNMMAQKLEEYSESKLSTIINEKKRIETLINNMHDPVIGLDENKDIIFINDEALNVSGLEKNNIIGKSIQDIAIKNDLVRSLIKDLIYPNEASTQDQELKIFADNKESYFEKEIININIIPTGEQKKKLIGYVILLKNITPFKELDFAKTNFIATISHELKTPISSIKMCTQLLEHMETGNLNEEQKQLVESIKEDSTRLLKITSELLKISQIDTGNIQLSIHPADSHTIVKYAIDTVKTLADFKKIIISFNSEYNLPLINTDVEKTSWVLTNLITNAIRYSPENSEITVTLKQENDKVCFSVKDEGRGIDDRYQKKIFDRYFQIPGSEKSGTGLGLAICKEFIEAQGGNIGVEAKEGIGSTFYFLLPKAVNV